MAKANRAICRKCMGVNRSQLAVLARANDAGKGLGISDDASRPAWERNYVREIMSRMRMF